MRKPAFCICKNKGTDQLRCNLAADQRLFFYLLESPIPLLSKLVAIFSVAVQPGFCRICLGTLNTGFLAKRLICVWHCSLVWSMAAQNASDPVFNPSIGYILSWRFGIAILPLSLIQEEQISVTGKRMYTKYS